MPELDSWSGRTDAPADCLHCGDRSHENDIEVNRRWARRHALNHPGHQVHLEVTHTRVYLAKEPS